MTASTAHPRTQATPVVYVRIARWINFGAINAARGLVFSTLGVATAHTPPSSLVAHTPPSSLAAHS